MAVDLDALYTRSPEGTPIIALIPPRPSRYLAAFLGIQYPPPERQPGTASASSQGQVPAAVLPARPAHRDRSGAIQPGQLLLLEEDGIHLTLQAETKE